MDRSWFPHSDRRGSFLRHDTVPSRKRGWSARYKTWFTVIECGVIATAIIFTLAAGVGR